MKTILILLAAAGLAFGASAQTTAYNLTPLVTNGNTLVISNGTTTLAGVTNPIIDVWQTGTVGLFAKLASDLGTNTFHVTNTFEWSPDKTNWLTQPVFTWVIQLNGTTGVRAHTNISRADTQNRPYLRLKTVGTAATNFIYITNLWATRNYTLAP